MFFIVSNIYILSILSKDFKEHQEVQNWNIWGIETGWVNQEKSPNFNVHTDGDRVQSKVLYYLLEGCWECVSNVLTTKNSNSEMW